VTRVLVCTPDKDLSQCIVDPRVVQFDRRREELRDEAGVRAKFGVEPAQIPAYLALVGDTADGIPGIPGFGPKTAATVLTAFGTLDAIPDDPSAWPTSMRGAPRLAATLAERRDAAALYQRLATLRTDGVVGAVDEWAWQGVEPEAAAWAARFEDPALLALAETAEAALANR
jgi:5'-3' exonuclease